MDLIYEYFIIVYGQIKKSS